MDPEPPHPPDAADEIVIWWRNADGSLDRSRSLRRENAEEMARTFSKMYPDQTYWLEPLKVTPRGSYGPMRRRRQDPRPPRDSDR